MSLPILKNKKGFTLIELLTVISIIAVLTAVLVGSFATASQRGKDGQRKSNIRQIQVALELYRDTNGSYPPSATITGIACGATWASGGVTYMQKFPCDPTGSKYFYSSSSPYLTYILASCLDNVADSEKTTSKPSGMNTCSPAAYFRVDNP